MKIKAHTQSSTKRAEEAMSDKLAMIDKIKAAPPEDKEKLIDEYLKLK